MAQLKEEMKKLPKFEELPKHLQRKYKNSIIFEKENKVTSKALKFDAEKLRQRKIDKQKTIQEKLQEFTLNPTEEKRLKQVFIEISGQKDSFGKQQILSILKKMKAQMSAADIDLMIWQFDEDLDGKITLSQFQRMYKMCMMDKTAAQPKKLFHLAQYLMYCRNGYYEITPENTYQLEYIRANDIVKNQLLKGNSPKQKQLFNQHNALDLSLTNLPKVKEIFEESIKTIFGNDYENQGDDGVQRTITFKTYLEKKTKKAIQNRRNAVEKTKIKLKTLKSQ